MVARKRRLRVVIDTNVFVRSFLARNASNANRRIIRLWLLEKKLQLLVCRELIEEYLSIFARVIGMSDDHVADWRVRFEEDGRSTVVALSRRYTASRDPDDNILLGVAFAGGADFLITNDRDLLELPHEFAQSLPFEILTPNAFLQRL